MAYLSVNELEAFSFRDCRILSISAERDAFAVTLEALIVLPENSQNTNFTESYAGTAAVRFTAPEILSLVKEGYRYYSVNGALLEEVPDEPVPEEEREALFERLSAAGAFLPECRRAEGDEIPRDGRGMTYVLELEMPEEVECDTSPGESYRMTVRFEKAAVSWDRYMNRVQGA